jgi:hypothetical protein
MSEEQHIREVALRKAVMDAERFIFKARRLIAEPDAYKWVRGTRLTAEVKRASMELTRSLSDYRQGGHR